MLDQTNHFEFVRHFGNLFTTLVKGFLGLVLLSTAAVAQVLVVEPACGVAGSTVRITGSGWAEPDPVCDYHFGFDKPPLTVFAPSQPDGLFGPPDRTTTIPADATPGEHDVQVELRLTAAPMELIQCRKTKFRVVTANKDPWDGNVTTPGGNSISIEFCPQDVCDVTPCSKIALTQVIKMTGEKTDGTGTRQLTFLEQGFPDPRPGTPNNELDDDVTAAGWTIDYQAPAPEPYYQTAGPTMIGMFGIQNGRARCSAMTDGPGRSDGAYPPDINKVILDFEVAAFCAGGTNKGEYLGTVNWRWERPKGGPATATAGTPDRNPPSQNLIDALNLWTANHSFTLPTKTPPTTGGEACTVFFAGP